MSPAHRVRASVHIYSTSRGSILAKSIEVINPYDNSVVGTVEAAGEPEVRLAIERASAVAGTMALESGKPMRYARGEVSRSVETFTFANPGV